MLCYIIMFRDRNCQLAIRSHNIVIDSIIGEKCRFQAFNGALELDFDILALG